MANDFCSCGRMEYIYQDHNDGYIDILWCPECGALRIIDEDDTEDKIPEREKRKKTP
jgi:hypothetical protein